MQRIWDLDKSEDDVLAVADVCTTRNRARAMFARDEYDIDRFIIDTFIHRQSPVYSSFIDVLSRRRHRSLSRNLLILIYSLQRSRKCHDHRLG